MEKPSWSKFQQLPPLLSVGVYLAITFLLGCATPHPSLMKKKLWFILSADKIERNSKPGLSITGSSRQAERLKYSDPVHEKSPIHSWHLRPTEMQLLFSSKHITQNAPIMCTMNWEYIQSQDKTEAKIQLQPELRCQKFRIWNCSRFSAREGEIDSNKRFMTCLDFFPFPPHLLWQGIESAGLFVLAELDKWE